MLVRVDCTFSRVLAAISGLSSSSSSSSSASEVADSAGEAAAFVSPSCLAGGAEENGATGSEFAGLDVSVIWRAVLDKALLDTLDGFVLALTGSFLLGRFVTGSSSELSGSVFKVTGLRGSVEAAGSSEAAAWDRFLEDLESSCHILACHPQQGLGNMLPAAEEGGVSESPLSSWPFVPGELMSSSVLMPLLSLLT